MTIHKQINKAVIQAAVGLLMPYVPELSSKSLIDAIRAYDGPVGRPKMLTRKEAAQALHVSLPTLDKMIADGRIHGVRLSPSCVRIEAESVNAFLADGCTSGRSAADIDMEA